MNWDIDKALRAFTADFRPLIRLGNETVNANRLKEIGLKPWPSSAISVDLWFVTFGRDPDPQLTFYGYSLHEACLRATKFLKKAKTKELAGLGLKRKPKKLNHYDRSKTSGKKSLESARMV
jgi:hypothetical protein